MFKSKAKLLKDTVIDRAKGILRNSTIPVQLKHLSNFWWFLKMSLTNCKVELKLRWTNHCVLAVVGVDNTNSNSIDIIFTIKNTNLCIPLRSVYLNEYKQNVK